MTKQDYELIAAAIKGAEKDAKKKYDNVVMGDIVKSGISIGTVAIAERLAETLEVENSRFEPDMFLKACGIK